MNLYGTAVSPEVEVGRFAPAQLDFPDPSVSTAARRAQERLKTPAARYPRRGPSVSGVITIGRTWRERASRPRTASPSTSAKRWRRTRGIALPLVGAAQGTSRGAAGRGATARWPLSPSRRRSSSTSFAASASHHPPRARDSVRFATRFSASRTLRARSGAAPCPAAVRAPTCRLPLDQSRWRTRGPCSSSRYPRTCRRAPSASRRWSSRPRRSFVDDSALAGVLARWRDDDLNPRCSGLSRDL